MASSGYLIQTQQESSSPKTQITPTRFWRWFDEDEFETIFEMVASGHFGEVKKATFKDAEYLKKKKQPITYTGQQVALKDPKGSSHNFVEEQYALSHEVSCTLLLHPSLVNYIGGVYLKNPVRVGIVMQLLAYNLRHAIEKVPQLGQRRVQLKVAKQIASGMNFLHSLNPHILHRDLRTPNILVTDDLECKIADFGISNNVVYENFKTVAMYTSLIPPECLQDQRKFTTKGDIYFYGWILVELSLGKQVDSYDTTQIARELGFALKEDEEYKNLILKCLHHEPTERPSFSDILLQLNSFLGIKYDFELITQHCSLETLKQAIEEEKISSSSCDSLGRTLIHHACIHGKLEMMKYLVSQWGDIHLVVADKFQTTLSHFAARNGRLEVLKYLEQKQVLSNERDNRFQTTALDLAIAMKHWDCAHFLISRATQETLDSALLSSSSEGNLELVKELIAHGANLECHLLDIGVTALDRAAYNGHLDVVSFLLEKGADVNQTCFDGRTPLWNAAQNGHTNIVMLLTKYGAELDRTRTDDGVTALFMAAQNGRTEIVNFLLQNGADPNKPRTDTNGAPLLVAAERGQKIIIELLVQYGADVNDSRTADGVTPLFMASQEGHSEIVEFLIKKKADPNKCRINGTSPLLMATVRNHIETVAVLLEGGANKNLQYFGRTALYYAQRDGNQKLVDLLTHA